MVKIKIINVSSSSNSNELKAIEDLKNLLERSIPKSAEGEIILACNLTLSGQDPRDVDILMAGQLKNCLLKDYYTNDPKYKKKDLYIDSFCTVIELKLHTERDVRLNATNIEVRYQNTSWKNATEQNEKQRYSVMNYFFNDFGYKPWVTNFIWLKNITAEQLNSIKKGNPIGALPSRFTFNNLVDLMINQNVLIQFDNQTDKAYHLRQPGEAEEFQKDFHKFLQSKKTIPFGLYTRKKLDTLLQFHQEKSIFKEGDSLVVISGRAGTGKTFSLIQSALSIANEATGNRCLILTYNHALVSDIRRMLHFMNIPDGLDTYTVQIKTLHSFFMDVMKIMDIKTDKIYGKNFIREYNKSLNELNDFVEQLLTDKKDIATLKEDNDKAIDWDYIFIDEGQDWNDLEKNILFHIYGPQRIQVADGIDQFIRKNKKQIWQREIENAKVELKNTGLRQKTNLSLFVNDLANAMGLDWEIQPNKIAEWSGGRVIIKNGYEPKLHEKLVKELRIVKCDNYDMLFLVPPSMVMNGRFSKLELWKNHGISIFDGTDENLRQSYPTDITQHRLFQYDSCRGLEGWTTVCLHFDELIKYKTKEAKDFGIDSLELQSEEEKNKKYAYLWSLMPLTRAIDTLLITITDPKSEIAQVLKKVAVKNNNFVTWDVKEQSL